MQKYCSEKCQAEAKRLRKKRQQDLINGIEPIMDLQHQEYLTFSKAAILMGCTRQYIYKLVANGKLKASRLSSRMTFVRKNDIEKMFEGNPYKRVIPASKSKPSKKAKAEKPTQNQEPTKGKEENEVLRAENDVLKAENVKVKQRISQLDEKAVERVITQLVYAKEELASAKSYNTTLMEMYNDLKARWNAIWQEPEMTDAWRRVEARKEIEAKEKARQEAEAKRERMARQNRYIGVLDKFIHEGHEALSSFAKTDRVNFNEKESASIYYGIMASAVKHNIGLDSKACIESAAKRFLSGMSWKGFTDFKQECVTSWTELFATNEVQFTDNAIDSFLAFVDHMSCSADTYVSLGGSNGCANQLTNWDGTQKIGLGTYSKKRKWGHSM